MADFDDGMKPYSHKGMDKGVKIGTTIGAILSVVAVWTEGSFGLNVPLLPALLFRRGAYALGLLVVSIGIVLGGLIGGGIGFLYDYYQDRRGGR